MDEFGVLTERYGLKPQGKSAPMAELKRPATINNPQNRNVWFKSGSATKSSWNSNSANGSFLDDHSVLFQSSTIQKTENSDGFGGYDDIFGEFPKSSKASGYQSSGNSFDYDSIFMDLSKSGAKSTPLSLYDDDDIFGGMPGLKRDSFASPPRQSAPIDDLLGDFDGMGAKSKSSNENNAAGFDDLIPGFGGSSPPNNRAKSEARLSQQSTVNSTKSTFSSSDDPFVVLESTSTPASTSSELFPDPLKQFNNLKYSGGKTGGSPNAIPPLRPPPKSTQVLKADKVKSSGNSSIDELEDFAMGRVRNNGDGRSYVRPRDVRTSAATTKKATVKPEAQYRHTTEVKESWSAKSSSSKYKEAADAQENQQKGKDDMEFFFSMGSRSSSVPRSRASTSIFNGGGPEVTQRTSFGASSNIKRASSATNMVDDLSSIFGASPLFDEFEEVEGESEERRTARLNRQQRTNARAAKAVADMNQRDLQNRWEQEERRRIAETLDVEIKRWAAGKEGNMRALLSSLQYVLGPECGWEPVSLTDLITSASVKKIYRKASLYVHPDKVQQKGANLQQKYTAEKVFDILKEAWTKFNTEELS